ncbi:MAG: class I mannose-6-phosphate isomerase [Chitinispirillaceae bacterium]|nr:class I mannose-6-phosphate isomerase [Chitinispirillaceae bacterium]
MDLPVEPLFFKPIYKETIWGGSALRTRFKRPLGQNLKIGESWEVASLGADQSAVSQGPLDGKTLGFLAAEAPEALLGKIDGAAGFPLLFKMIDARERLSVQVHPDDDQALEHGWGRNGKTECWYVVDAKENARIIAGFREEVSLEKIRRAIETESLNLLLDSIPVKSGDVLFIPAGTVHAIMEGTLLYEVQETSDITLRLYDWGRVDAAGKPRQLHVAEALSVIDTHVHDHRPLAPVVLDENGCTHAYHAACRYFALERYAFIKEKEVALPGKRSFRVITVLNGKVSLSYAAGSAEVPAGTTVLLPACLRDVRASGAAGAEFLLSSVPDLEQEIIAPLRKQGVPDEAIRNIGGFPERNDLIKILK